MRVEWIWILVSRFESMPRDPSSCRCMRLGRRVDVGPSMKKRNFMQRTVCDPWLCIAQIQREGNVDGTGQNPETVFPDDFGSG